MVIRDRSGARPHDFCCDGLCRDLHRLHPADEGLVALVRERRLASIQLNDPERQQSTSESENKKVITVDSLLSPALKKITLTTVAMCHIRQAFDFF